MRRFGALRAEQPGVDFLHRDAFAFVDVARRFARRRPFFFFVRVAQLHEERLRVLAARARQAPGEVAPAADEHVRRDRRDDALGVHAAAVQVAPGRRSPGRSSRAAAPSPPPGARPRPAARRRAGSWRLCGASLARAAASAAAVELGEPGSITTAPAGVGPVGRLVVRERFARRRRRFGVVGLTQVAVDLQRLLRCRVSTRGWRGSSSSPTSAPPPLPKIEPMKAKPAIASVSVDRSELFKAFFGKRFLVGVDARDPGFEVRDHLFALGAFRGLRAGLRRIPSLLCSA